MERCTIVADGAAEGDGGAGEGVWVGKLRSAREGGRGY